MIKAVLFDCFGVLLTDALAAMVGELAKQDPEAANQARELAIMTSRGILSSQDFAEQVAAILNISPDELRKRVVSGEVKNQALLAYVLELRKQYKTAILSNVSSEGFWRRFSHEELAPYFDDVILSADVGHAKPDPEVYAIAAERLGVAANECLLVDDREDYLAGARNAGMVGILYTSVPELKAAVAPMLTQAL